MKKFLIFFAIGSLLLVAQSIWSVFFHTRSAPEFVFILVVFSGIYHKPFGGMILAFILGFMVDSLTGLMPGLFASIYTLVFVFCRLAGRRFYMRSYPFQVLIVLATTLLAKILEYIVLNWLAERGHPGLAFFWPMWPLFVWNALAAIPLIGWLERTEQRLSDRYMHHVFEHRGFI